jgi:hypothetical protein
MEFDEQELSLLRIGAEAQRSLFVIQRQRMRQRRSDALPF